MRSDYRFEFVEIILDLIKSFICVDDSLGLVVLTNLVLGLVRVILIQHGALLIAKVPGGTHPATVAPVTSVCLAEQCFVGVSVSRTINGLLL